MEALQVLTVLIFFAIRKLVFGKRCLTDDDCGWCGICVDKEPNVLECLFPFNDLSEDCNLKQDLCSVCENESLCEVGYGFKTAVCNCNRWYQYGKYCELRVPEGKIAWYASGISVFFSTYRKELAPNSLFSVRVFAIAKVRGRYLSFVVTNSEGSTTWFQEPIDCYDYRSVKLYPYRLLCLSGSERKCTRSLPACTHLYTGVLQFPYKSVPSGDVLTYYNRVIGYISKVTVVASSGLEEVFRFSYPTAVLYKDYSLGQLALDSAPIIEVDNCGESLDSVQYFSRRDVIKLEISVGYRLALMRRFSPTKVEWSLRKIMEYNDPFMDPSRFQVGGSFSWTIPPFRLETGRYKVRVVVSNVPFLSNFVECYLEVRSEPLVAAIKGGSSRVTGKNRGILLSAEDSFDPNEDDDHQHHLSFDWLCEPNCNHLVKRGVTVFIPKSRLSIGATYSFTLILKAPFLMPEYAYQEVTVSYEDFDVSIYCQLNCLRKVDPRNMLCLQVSIDRKFYQSYKYLWTYQESGGLEKSADEIRDQSTSSYAMCTLKNVLKEGEDYYFRASIKEKDITIGLKVTVGEKLANISCTVNPLDGTAFKTLFNISCSGLPKNGGKDVYVYEFYDKYSSDPDREFSGRMIATNKVGVINNVKISRGTIVVLVYDEYGLAYMSKHEVTVYHSEVTQEDVDNLFFQMKTDSKLLKEDKLLRDASVVPDIIKRTKDKLYVVEKLVELEEKIKFNSQGDMKMGLSLLYNTFKELSNDGKCKTSQELTKRITSLVLAMSKTFKKQALSKKTVPFITKSMMEQLVDVFSNVVEQSLLIRNESMLSVSEVKVKEEEYDDALSVSQTVQSVLENIAKVQIYRQIKGFKSDIMMTDSSLTSIRVQSDNPVILIDSVNEGEIYPFEFSPQLSKSLSTNDELTIHSTVMKYNPFWTGRRDISTELINLILNVKTSFNEAKKTLTYLEHPLEIVFTNIKNTSKRIVFEVKQIDNGKSPCDDKLDKGVTVLRLELPARSTIFFMFIHNGTPFEDIKFRVSKNLRPDCDFMRDSSATTPSAKNWVVISNNNEHTNFAYVGITAGPRVQLGESINVTLAFHYNLCLTWIRLTWVSELCTVKEEYSPGMIHCSCNHASVFSAVMAVPPNEIDPLHDISLFITIENNYFIAVFVVCLLITYLILGVWACKEDKKDKGKRKVLVLEDNFPNGNYSYVLAVCTGCHLWAGTDSNVGIRIFGNKANSLAHILKSSLRKVLQTGSEDWFLVNTFEHLGVINQIHLWHDGTGRYPDWFCEKIIVYDLENAVSYHFFVEEWLSLEFYGRTETVIVPATAQDFSNLKRLFLENIVFGFRDSHLLGNFLFHHPRHKYSRTDRVTMFFSFCFVTMLVSIAFYGLKDGYNGVDEFKFSPGTKDFLITVQTFLLTMVAFVMVLILFKNSYKAKLNVHEKKHLTYVSPDHKKSLLSENSTLNFIHGSFSRRTSRKSYFEQLVKSLGHIVKQSPLLPVTLTRTTVTIHKRKLYLIAYAVCLLIIVVSSFFIVLYGLRFGTKKSKLWLWSVSVVLLGHILVLSPIKIVLFSIVFASTHERQISVTTYDIEPEEITKENVGLDKNLSSNLLKRRSSRIYKRLSMNEVNLGLRKRKRRTFLKNRLDLGVFITYILLLCFLFSNFKTEMQLQTNQHVEKLLGSSHHRDHPECKELFLPTEFKEYLEDVLVNSLYKIVWYNGMELSSKGGSSNFKTSLLFRTADFSSKLVQRPRLRQIRIMRVPCGFHKVFNQTASWCVPPWSPRVEDRDDYSFGWNLAFYEDVEEGESPWMYKFPSHLVCHVQEGWTGTSYPCGGYVKNLSLKRYKTRKYLEKLKEGSWIDNRTRVVIIDLTLFNGNTNLFTEITMVAEQLSFGIYLMRVFVNSTKTDIISNLWKGSFIVFLLMTLYLTFDSLMDISHIGFINYFMKFSNLYHVLLIVLGFLSVLFFVFYLQNLNYYLDQSQNKGTSEVVHFEEAVKYAIVSFDILTVLFCCLVFRAIHLTHSRRLDLTVFLTVVKTKTYVCWILTTASVFNFVVPKLISFSLNVSYDLSVLSCSWARKGSSFTIDCYAVQNLTTSTLTKLCLVFVLATVYCEYSTEKRGNVKLKDNEKVIKGPISLKRAYRYYKEGKGKRKVILSKSSYEE